MKAVIIKNPTAPLFGEAEIVDRTIDITPCQLLIAQLYAYSKLVLKNPENHCEAAHNMAYIIEQIKRAIIVET